MGSHHVEIDRVQIDFVDLVDNHCIVYRLVDLLERRVRLVVLL